MTIVMVGAIAVLVSLCAAIAVFARVSIDTERARLAADQAALAGASVVLGALRSPSGEFATACEAARAAASRNGSELMTCREMSTGVQVEVARPTALDRTARAVARAGLESRGASDLGPHGGDAP